MGSVWAVRANRRTRQTGRAHHRGSVHFLDWRLNAQAKNPQSQAQLIRYFGLPAVRAPDTPIPVARCYLIRGPRETRIGVPSLYMPDNNIVEQDHRAVKRVVWPMLGFKSFRSAAATIAGIELMHMIRKGQLHATSKLRPAQQFSALAG